MKNLLKLTGKSIDNKLVFSGIFNFIETSGLPLHEILIYFKENNYLIDWLDYYKTALNSGINFERLFKKIEEECLDVYSKEEINLIKNNIKFYRMHYEK